MAKVSFTAGRVCLITAREGNQEHTVLFDTGPEDYAFERNVSRLGADLGKVYSIVLSHGYWDHAGVEVSLQRESVSFLDNMFAVNGEILRHTPFERGLPGQVRKNAQGQWEKDELLEPQLKCR